jgi:glyoxylase-like metal-dependent hydrolase (beta-lactamase superfamily II)
MHILSPGMQVLERGWLSANSVLFATADGPATLVDSGYCSHAGQTLALVEHALAGRPLALLINTHLHSDHCGGNAALQQRYPALRTLVPPGDAQAVRDWDESVLSYAATGQDCPRFQCDGVLPPGGKIALGGRPWQIHAAPGHDPHALLLFDPHARVLVSADALWQSGFGVVFPELEGAHAFADVDATLDLIEALAPVTVVPGHGPVFTDVAAALATARRRLDGFVRDPARHAVHAAKVLVKFKLLEWQRQELLALLQWAQSVPYLQMLQARYFADAAFEEWLREVLRELVVAGAARIERGVVVDA